MLQLLVVSKSGSEQMCLQSPTESPRVAFCLSEMQEDCSMQIDQHRKMPFCQQSSAQQAFVVRCPVDGAASKNSQ